MKTRVRLVWGYFRGLSGFDVFYIYRLPYIIWIGIDSLSAPIWGTYLGFFVMIISCFSELVAAATDIDVNNQTAKQNWRDLYSVYHSALNNAPDGIIGVGAITYAESQLIAFQNNEGVK